jgi:hypothetical protein
MSISSNDWVSIDNNTEHKIINNIEFIRPKGSKTIKIYCEDCNDLVSTVEDCESLRENNLCESCFVNKSFINKDNTYN